MRARASARRWPGSLISVRSAAFVQAEESVVQNWSYFFEAPAEAAETFHGFLLSECVSDYHSWGKMHLLIPGGALFNRTPVRFLKKKKIANNLYVCRSAEWRDVNGVIMAT